MVFNPIIAYFYELSSYAIIAPARAATEKVPDFLRPGYVNAVNAGVESQDYEELNDYFRQCCLKKLDHRVAGKTETVAERFEQDKAAALALPDYAFDPYASSEAKVVRQPINHLS